MNRLSIQKQTPTRDIYIYKYIYQVTRHLRIGLTLLEISILFHHYSNVIMSTMASQITGFWTVCSADCSGTHQRKHQSSAWLTFAMGIHRWPNGLCEGNPPVTGGFPPQRSSNAETVSIWWRHRVFDVFSEFTLISFNITNSIVYTCWYMYNQIRFVYTIHIWWPSSESKLDKKPSYQMWFKLTIPHRRADYQSTKYQTK